MTAELILPGTIPHQDRIRKVYSASEGLACEAYSLNKQNRLALADYLEFVGFTGKCHRLNAQFRKAIVNDPSLPPNIRRDPPSLRSTMWLVMTDEALYGEPCPKPLAEYPYRLYAITRCHLNAVDDFFDSRKPPITSSDIDSESDIHQMTSTLAREFLNLRTGNTVTLQRCLSFYRALRDMVIEKYNRYEVCREKLTFDEGLRQSIELMGPLNYYLVYMLTSKREASRKNEEKVGVALTWYAAAGKLIDDVTDWLKDFRRGEFNIYSQALCESGEFDKVVKVAPYFTQFGPRAFIPVSLLKTIAPIATDRTLRVVDGYIDKVDQLGLKRFTTSLMFIRQNMWAYALNEGQPQIKSVKGE